MGGGRGRGPQDCGEPGSMRAAPKRECRQCGQGMWAVRTCGQCTMCHDQHWKQGVGGGDGVVKQITHSRTTRAHHPHFCAARQQRHCHQSFCVVVALSASDPHAQTCGAAEIFCDRRALAFSTGPGFQVFCGRRRPHGVLHVCGGPAPAVACAAPNGTNVIFSRGAEAQSRPCLPCCPRSCDGGSGAWARSGRVVVCVCVRGA
jgi:hypothetical protein